jgi:hypothetical protein
MPRPKTKKELIELSRQNFDKLLGYIDQLTEEEREDDFPAGILNRNIRDVLAHLHHWHMLFLNWYQVGMGGQKPEMPAKGYTWKTTSALNTTIQKKYEDTPLKKVRKLLNQSFDDVQEIIGRHTDKELFEKKRYHWTGSTSLGSYLVSATSSHCDWALKLIKRAKKENGKISKKSKRH